MRVDLAFLFNNFDDAFKDVFCSIFCQASFLQSDNLYNFLENLKLLKQAQLAIQDDGLNFEDKMFRKGCLKFWEYILRIHKWSGFFELMLLYIFEQLLVKGRAAC